MKLPQLAKYPLTLSTPGVGVFIVVVLPKTPYFIDMGIKKG